MVDSLAAKGRKLVVIIDPHIKVDPEYKIYKDGIEKKLFVKLKDGSTFVGRLHSFLDDSSNR
jgi:alpha-glucosidase (family GH31 glycosyl hydrolase)